MLVVMRDGAPAFVELSADLDDADPVSPSVLVSPVAARATLGGTATLSVQAMGGGLTYQWRKDGVDIAGAHAATLTLTDVTTGDVGDYSVIVRNAAGAASSASARITLDHVSFSGFYTGNFGSATAGDFALMVRDDGMAVLLANLPTIDRAVVVTDLRIGADGSFVAGSPAPALTVPSLDAVRFYGGPITGQISGGVLHLSIPALGLNADAARSDSVSLNSSRAGFYQALPINQSHGEIYLVASDSGQAWLLEARAAGARSSAGTLASDGSGVIALDDETLSLQVAGGLLHGSVGNGDDTVTLMPSSAASGPHRLINISTRGLAGTGENTMIAGFVIGGAQSKDVLIRVLGPALQSVGVNGYLADPRLQIFNQKGVGILSNDNWSSDDPEGIRWATARVGASPPLASNSTDAAILTRLDPGPYTAHVTGADAKSGVVLIEVYDAGSFTVAEPKLVNISTRGWVGSGENVLIAGLVITGDAPKKVLLRALGPALVGEGVKGFLADPGIALYQGPAVIKRNDDWDENGDGEAGLVSAAEARVGAQPKLGPGSKDAALLLYLKPGVYTLQVSGVNATTGVALVEAYEVGD